MITTYYVITKFVDWLWEYYHENITPQQNHRSQDPDMFIFDFIILKPLSGLWAQSGVLRNGI